jgi:hypothetical protein
MTTTLPNGHKIYQNDRKIFQMAIKYTSIFRSKVLQIYPNWDFWFENKPSGNPAAGRKKCLVIIQIT